MPQINMKKPEWLKVRIRKSDNYGMVKSIINELSLNTVCEEANCPNRSECFNHKTATFMILGNICTRNCTFCNVTHGNGEKINHQEPEHIAEAVDKLELEYVVITSVTRDDLSDGGAGHFAAVVKAIRQRKPQIAIEVLIPDFLGKPQPLLTLINTHPNIINHNIETVPRLYQQVRPQADYQRSLNLLKTIKKTDASIFTKSGLMVGLGESKAEIYAVFEDLRNSNCDFLTIGQYLAPSKKHFPIAAYIPPETFDDYKSIALKLGFKAVASGPLVRSSYQAAQMMQ